MVLFALAGVVWAADRVPSTVPGYRWRYPAMCAFAGITFFVSTFQIPRVDHYGFKEAAHFLAGLASATRPTVLVSSDSGGEGLLISEIAMLQPHPAATILRGTKSLASVDWNGAGYRCTYSNSAQILHFMRDENIRYVVVDSFPPQVRFTHDALLKKTIENRDAFELVRSVPSHERSIPGEIKIYRSRF